MRGHRGPWRTALRASHRDRCRPRSLIYQSLQLSPTIVPHILQIPQFPHQTYTRHPLFLYCLCHHIKPSSVDCYLSGICSSLKPYYPEIRKPCKHTLVSCTLRGMKKLRGAPTKRKSLLTNTHLCRYGGSATSYDDTLFLAIVFVGFHALMHLGELTWPDRVELRSW